MTTANKQSKNTHRHPWESKFSQCICQPQLSAKNRIREAGTGPEKGASDWPMCGERISTAKLEAVPSISNEIGGSINIFNPATEQSVVKRCARADTWAVTDRA